MGRKKVALAAKAWGLLRQALLWARKGGAFKTSLLSRGSRSNGHHSRRGSGDIGYQTRYGEELSLSDTPVFWPGNMQSAKSQEESMRLAVDRISFVNSQSHTDLDFGDDCEFVRSRREAFCRTDFGMDDDEGESEEFASVEWLDGAWEEGEEEEEFTSAALVDETQEMTEVDEKGVDMRAEEFIARFYQQMELQRQESLLQYHEMLNRGA